MEFLIEGYSVLFTDNLFFACFAGFQSEETGMWLCDVNLEEEKFFFRKVFWNFFSGELSRCL